jgi:hypothetical protein
MCKSTLHKWWLLVEVIQGGVVAFQAVLGRWEWMDEGAGLYSGAGFPRTDGLAIDRQFDWWYSSVPMEQIGSNVRVNYMHAHAHPEMTDPVE